jgi:ribosome-associated protein
VDTKSTDQTDADESPQYDGPSKSQLKRESTALQDMGAELVTLSAGQLKKIDMPEALLIAVREAQRITKNGAIRRQRQYIGKLMRDVDVGPIKAALDEIKGVSVAATARQHALERLRTEVMENEEVLHKLLQEHPELDIQQLRQLRRNAIKEKQLNKPPRAYRELFRILRELQGTAASDADAGDIDDSADTEANND